MKGRLEEALEHYNIALGLEPQDVKLYLNASSAYKKSGAKPYNNLGVIYFFDLGQPDRAIEQYKTALRLEPQNARTHLNIGIAYRAKGLTAKADYHLGLARRLNPGMFKGKPPTHPANR
jgi:tetratricopeptide (TPR) repeat protein